MGEKSWLPKGFLLPDGGACGAVAAAGERWQIVSAGSGRYALTVLPGLLDRWSGMGLVVRSMFAEVTSQGRDYAVFPGTRGRLISSVQRGPYPDTFAQAMGFAAALRRTRGSFPAAALGGGLYLEQLELLLPAGPGDDREDDRLLLGTWLSGGVRVSAADLGRLCRLLGWLDLQQVEQVVSAAGFWPEEGFMLTRSGGDGLVQTGPAPDAPPRRRSPLAEGKPFTLPGRPKLERFFNEHVVEVAAQPEKYRRMGITFPAAAVLHGPSGCGKTYAVRRLADYLGWPVYNVDSGSIGSSYIHETGRKIAALFDEAAKNAPAMIIIDEMEAFLTGRSYGHSADLFHNEEMAEFLRRIAGAADEQVLVLAMTNLIEAIDPAILRHGRFDHLVEVTYPNEEEAGMLLRSLLQGLPVAGDVDTGLLAGQLRDRPVSDVAFTVKEAGRIAAREDRQYIDAAAFAEALRQLSRPAAETHRMGF